MLPSIQSIKQQRLKINLTQKQLANEVGVSTSMINQIESGRCKPSYNTAKKIFESLAKIEGQISPRTTGNICSTKIEKLSPTNTVSDAGKIMHRKKIDQIPIFEGVKLKGLITIDTVNEFTERKEVKIKNVMKPKPPIIDFEFPANGLAQLTRISGCILVEKNSEIVGIITSSDLLKMM